VNLPPWEKRAGLPGKVGAYACQKIANSVNSGVMDNIDLRSVVFTGVITEILCAVVLTALWRQNRNRFAGLSFWVMDFACQAIGLTMIFLRGTIPDWISLPLANSLIVAGAVLGYIGFERFTGKRGPQAQNYALLGLFILANAYLSLARPNLDLRSVLLSWALLAICGQCLWLLLRRVDKAMRPLTKWTGIVFGSFCLLSVFRIAFYHAHPLTGNDYFHSGRYESFILIVYQMLFILLTYSLALMVNKRLQLDLRTQEEKFFKTFHSSPYAILLTQLSDNRVFEVNDGFLKITGYPLSEVLGKTIYDLRFWAHIEDRAAIIRKLLEGGRVRGVELLFRRRSGEPFTGLYSADLVTINSEPCILSSVNDISERKLAEVERERLISEREKALSEIKALSGLLPICASCKKIRDDKGYWNQIESYIESHSDAEFSHGICPDCMGKLYPNFAKDNKPK
jgi:PAS domain S-box-containing protein